MKKNKKKEIKGKKKIIIVQYDRQIEDESRVSSAVRASFIDFVIIVDEQSFYRFV